MAVYLATSDEAIPLLVSMPAYWDKLALLMAIKVVYAIFVGFMLDFVLRKALPRSLRGGYTGHADEVDCHEEHSDEQGQPQPIWKAALRHTLEIFVFIFAFSLVFGLIVEGVGEDVFAAEMCIRDRPQDAQGVLPETAQRLTDRPHHAPGKVFPPAEGVAQALLGAVGHRVDGSLIIPPSLI